MRTLTIIRMLLLSMILCLGFSCSDNDDNSNNDNRDIPQITEPLPDINTPQTAGSTITITGTNFKDDCEIVLREAVQTKSISRVYFPAIISRSSTSISFVVPEGIDGTFDIAIKQAGKEYTIGTIVLKSNLTGIWKWIKSTSSGQTEEHESRYFIINQDGTGSYIIDDNETEYTWSIEESTITITYSNKEQLVVTIKEINSQILTVEYQADNQTWEESLIKADSGYIVIRNQAITLGSSNISLTEAICKGQYTSTTEEVTFGICYSNTNDTPTIDTDKSISATNAENEGVFAIHLTNLNKGETYYYRAYLIKGNKVRYGEVKSFSTANIITQRVTNIEHQKATCFGQYNSKAPTLEYGICYSKDGSAPTVDANKTAATSANKNGEYSVLLKGLSPSSTYYYRAYIITAEEEIFYGEVKSFKTIGVQTVGYTKKDDNAICKGKYYSTENVPTEYGICYSTSNNTPTTSDRKVTSSDLNEAGEFTAKITGLKYEETYHYRAYVIVNDEISYGEIKSIHLDFPVGTWKQTLLEIDEGSKHWEEKRDNIIIYLENGKIATLNGSELIIDEKSSYSYDESTHILNSTYYDADDQEMTTITGKVTMTNNGFKLIIETKEDTYTRIATNTFIRQPDAPGTN